MNNDKHRPTPSRSRHRWIGGSLLLVLLVVIGYRLHRSSHPPIEPQRGSELGGSGVIHSEVPAAMKAPVMTAKRGAPGTATTVEICGVGSVPLDTDDPASAGRYMETLTAKARLRWLATLLDSDDTRARAAGLFLQGKLDVSGPLQPMAEQSRDQLVQLAVGSANPFVYAMAVYACNNYSDPSSSSSCDPITLQHWSALDADNAVPWLLLARNAHAANDTATEATAFSQAAASHKVDPYNFSLYSVTESALPNDTTPLERWTLAIELIGIESGTASLQYGIAARHCSAAAIQDAQVRQQCDELAELFVSKGTTLLDLSIGAAIGTRAGWPQTRVTSLQDERDALMQAGMQQQSNGSDGMWTCDSVRRGNAYMSQWVRLGEVGALRDALEQAGETVPELARRRREFVATLMRDAQRQADQSPPQPPP
jgi:hypothetical protein